MSGNTLALLPVGHLESTRLKVTQMTESIVALQRIVENGNQNAMPAWPDLLAKYNVLLSQAHNLTMSLVSGPASSQAAQAQQQQQNKSNQASASATTKPLAKLVLHPSAGLADPQLDNDLIPLLRNQQTNEVLRLESDTVRRLAERLPSAPQQREHPSAPETYAAVLRECERVREEHDARCDRAARAVAMLRDKYEWRARVAVETEEPEDFSFLSPGLPAQRLSPVPISGGTALDTNASEDSDESSDNTGEEDAELEDVVGPSLRPTPTPAMDNESTASTPH